MAANENVVSYPHHVRAGLPIRVRKENNSKSPRVERSLPQILGKVPEVKSKAIHNVSEMEDIKAKA